MQIIWDLSYIRIKNIQHLDHFLIENKLADSGCVEKATYLACCRLAKNVINIRSAGRFSFCITWSGPMHCMYKMKKKIAIRRHGPSKFTMRTWKNSTGCRTEGRINDAMLLFCGTWIDRWTQVEIYLPRKKNSKDISSSLQKEMMSFAWGQMINFRINYDCLMPKKSTQCSNLPYEATWDIPWKHNIQQRLHLWWGGKTVKPCELQICGAS